MARLDRCERENTYTHSPPLVIEGVMRIGVGGKFGVNDREGRESERGREGGGDRV